MNIMTNDYHWHTNGFYVEQRMSHWQDTMRQADRRRQAGKKEETGCITAVPRNEGSRFGWINK